MEKIRIYWKKIKDVLKYRLWNLKGWVKDHKKAVILGAAVFAALLGLVFGFCCDTYSDYKELFRRDDINLVVSACYSNEHYAVALDLLNHGHNVLNEKLLCKTPQLAQGLIDAA